MQRLFLSFLSVCLLALAAFAAVCSLGAYAYLSPGPLAAAKLVLIERGSGVSRIAEKLEQDSVIHNALLFKIAVRLTQGQGTLKAGEYDIPAFAPMAAVLQMLRDGQVYERKFTVPEGLTGWQIVALLRNIPELEGEVKDSPPEGSLLPETYHFVSGDTRQDQIAHMQKAMRQTLETLWPGRAEDLPFDTKKEALILASIIEKETGVASERKRIAGVFVNRLRKGMPLQTDPTVIYALTGGKIQDEGKGPLGRRLLRKDLQVESPYNTYRYPGLPPGPIANPGRAALEAALQPERHDYLYFVADGTGGHIFSKTLSEHNRNAAKWRRIRKSR